MKKVLLCAIIICMLLACGCVNREAKEMVEKTNASMTSGDYKSALEYGEFAIEKGYKDDDFVDLVENLRNYNQAKTALENQDVIKARVYLEQIDDPEETGMKNAVVNLEIEIAKLESEFAKVKEKIKDLRDAVSDANYHYVIREGETLLGSQYISDDQKTEIGSLVETSRALLEGASEGGGTVSPSTGEKVLTQQEAIELARKELSMGADATATVTDGGSYYQVSFTQYIKSGNEIIEDGAVCKVDKKTGRMYDHIG